MEEENKKIRRKEKRVYNELVRQLVLFVKKRDKRVMERQVEVEKLRQEMEEEKRRKKKEELERREKEKVAARKRMEEGNKISSWMMTGKRLCLRRMEMGLNMRVSMMMFTRRKKKKRMRNFTALYVGRSSNLISR